MMYKMAGMLKERKPVTRSRLTQTKTAQQSDNQTQTQGLISTLLASFAVDTSQKSVQECSRKESDSDSSSAVSVNTLDPPDFDENKWRSLIGYASDSSPELSSEVRCLPVDSPDIEVEQSGSAMVRSVRYQEVISGLEENNVNRTEPHIRAACNISNNSERKRGSGSNGVDSNSHETRETGEAQKGSSCHASKFAELKTRFESPDHLAKMNSTPDGNVGSSTEVAASFIRNSIDSLRLSLSLNKNSPSKRDNLNLLTSSNGHEVSQESDSILNQFKPAEDIRNEPAV